MNKVTKGKTFEYFQYKKEIYNLFITKTIKLLFYCSQLYGNENI